MRQESQGDVAIPAVPTTNLVLVQSDLILGQLEGFLDHPTHSGYPNHLGEARLPWSEHIVVGYFRLIGYAAPSEQPVSYTHLRAHETRHISYAVFCLNKKNAT